MMASTAASISFVLRLLQILRLETTAAPAAGSGTVEAQRAAQAIIIVDTGEQTGDLAHRCARSVAAQFEQPSHFIAWVICENGVDVMLRQDSSRDGRVLV